MSGLTVQFVVLLAYSCFFALCEGTLEETAEVGEDATLQCQKDTSKSIILIEWSRADLESDGYVFFFRENRLHEHYHHPSFRGRVGLKDPEMKNGDASVILKNVTVNDSGTYECFVSTGSSGRRRRDTEFSQFINLKVTESGHTAGHTEERRDEKGGDRNRGNVTSPLITVFLLSFVLLVLS